MSGKGNIKNYADFKEAMLASAKRKSVATNSVKTINPLIGEYWFGLDLGSQKIRGVCGRMMADEKLEVTTFSETPAAGIDRGWIIEPDAAANCIKTVVNDLMMMSGAAVEQLTVMLPASQLKRFTYRSVIEREHELTPVTPAEIGLLYAQIQDLEMPAGERVIHFYPEDFFMDDVKLNAGPAGITGKWLEAEFHVWAAQYTVVQNIINCVEKAGFSVETFIPAYIAAAQSVLTDDEKKSGVALMEIGVFSTQIAIYFNGKLQDAASIPFGGASITGDIMNGCVLSAKEAERVKIKSGCAIAGKVKENEIVTIPDAKGFSKEISVSILAQIIQARVEEILEMAKAEIKKAGFEGRLMNGIVVTGGTAELKLLNELIETHTGLKARTGYPVEKLTGSAPMEIRNPVYANCIGQAISAYEKKKQEYFLTGKLNLNSASFPSEVKEKEIK